MDTRFIINFVSTSALGFNFLYLIYNNISVSIHDSIGCEKFNLSH